jgi:Kdo2-lipid IVA lauroyltransferase/acyltransferase
VSADTNEAGSKGPPRDLRAEKRYWRREVAQKKDRKAETTFDKIVGVPIRVFFFLLSFFFNVLPLQVGMEIGAFVGSLGYYVAPRRRRIALENLRLALGHNVSLKERKRIAHASFANFGRVGVEFIRFPKNNPDHLSQHIQIFGLESFQAVKDLGRGALALSAHLGNFELIAATGNLMGHGKNHLMGRKIKPPVVDRFVCGLRKGCGVETIPSKDGIKTVLRKLRNNENVGVVLDQNMRRGIGIFVNFFGVAASTTPALAIMALRRKIPILPVFMIRKGKSAKHHMIFLPQVPCQDTGDREKDTLVNTQRMTWVVEEIIRRYPEQWFWFHQRWRCRPPEESKPSPVPPVEKRPAFLTDFVSFLDEVGPTRRFNIPGKSC